MHIYAYIYIYIYMWAGCGRTPQPCGTGGGVVPADPGPAWHDRPRILFLQFKLFHLTSKGRVRQLRATSTKLVLLVRLSFLPTQNGRAVFYVSMLVELSVFRKGGASYQQTWSSLVRTPQIMRGCCTDPNNMILATGLSKVRDSDRQPRMRASAG